MNDEVFQRTSLRIISAKKKKNGSTSERIEARKKELLRDQAEHKELLAELSKQNHDAEKIAVLVSQKIKNELLRDTTSKDFENFHDENIIRSSIENLWKALGRNLDVAQCEDLAEKVIQTLQATPYNSVNILEIKSSTTLKEITQFFLEEAQDVRLKKAKASWKHQKKELEKIFSVRKSENKKLERESIQDTENEKLRENTRDAKNKESTKNDTFDTKSEKLKKIENEELVRKSVQNAENERLREENEELINERAQHLKNEKLAIEELTKKNALYAESEEKLRKTKNENLQENIQNTRNKTSTKNNASELFLENLSKLSPEDRWKIAEKILGNINTQDISGISSSKLKALADYIASIDKDFARKINLEDLLDTDEKEIFDESKKSQQSITTNFFKKIFRSKLFWLLLILVLIVSFFVVMDEKIDFKEIFSINTTEASQELI